MIEKIRALMALKISAQTIADGMGVSNSTVYRWLKGESLSKVRIYEPEFDRWLAEFTEQIKMIGGN